MTCPNCDALRAEVERLRKGQQFLNGLLEDIAAQIEVIDEPNRTLTDKLILRACRAALNPEPSTPKHADTCPTRTFNRSRGWRYDCTCGAEPSTKGGE